MFFGIGQGIGIVTGFQEQLAKSIVHGLAGGIMQATQGGKFGHGFLSAGLTQFSSERIGKLDVAGAGGRTSRIIASALIGGSVSRLTGGKFAHGAITGAFSRTFNDEAEHGESSENEGVDDFFEHRTEAPVGIDSDPSDMPIEIRESLESVMRSPVGDAVRAYTKNYGKIRVIRGTDSTAFAALSDGTIIYPPDLSAWKSFIRSLYPPVPGEELASMNYAVGFAHEIGHLPFIRLLPSIPRRAEESFVVRHFENSYRKWAGLPLRTSYAEQGDVK